MPTNKLKEKKYNRILNDINCLSSREFTQLIYDSIKKREREYINRPLNTLEYEEKLILALYLIWP